MRIRSSEEEGVAMVIALLVSMVLLILSTVIVAQSIHDAQSSGYDRQRLTSVGAAESGGNYYYALLQSTPLASLSCNPLPPQTIASAPATASFTATPTFFNATYPDLPGMPCTSPTPFTSTNLPTSVLITTTGTVAGQTPRTMQTYIRLSPVYGGFGAAVLTNNGTSFSNNFDIYGNSGNDGDVYILNGDLTITNTPHVRGNVYVPNGSATISNNSNVQGNLWADGSVTINNPSSVTGSVIASGLLPSTGSISGSGSIGTNATAATTISGVSVAGTKYPNTVSPQPPTQPFPQITYTATDNTNWINSGYSVVTFSGPTACSDARTLVEGGALVANTVIRITGPNPCTYSNSNNATITLNANLAIITDWGIDLAQRSDWNGLSGTKSVFFISTWPAPSPCPSGSSNKNVGDGNNTSFDSYAQVFFYTPCTAIMSNSNNYYGQVMGGNVTINNNYTMTYRPVLVPGYGTVTSFREDIAYVREAS
jgi:hypothetical protein